MLLWRLNAHRARERHSAHTEQGVSEEWLSQQERILVDLGPRLAGCQAADFSAHESLHVKLAYQYLLKTSAKCVLKVYFIIRTPCGCYQLFLRWINHHLRATPARAHVFVWNWKPLSYVFKWWVQGRRKNILWLIKLYKIQISVSNNNISLEHHHGHCFCCLWLFSHHNGRYETFWQRSQAGKA